MDKRRIKREDKEDGDDRRRNPKEPRTRSPYDDDLAQDFDVDQTGKKPRIVGPIEDFEDDYHTQLSARLGLHVYNLQNGTNLKFVRLEKLGRDKIGMYRYITLKVMDPSRNNSVFSFQTLVNTVSSSWTILVSRFQCPEHPDEKWDDTKIKDVYKSKIIKWLSDRELEDNVNNKKYYVVPEPELHENEWLHLLMEFSFSKHHRSLPLYDSPSLEIKKVVIETVEEEDDATLEAENAFFYISYKCNSDHPSKGKAGEYKAIIRKTMDGKPGHMQLIAAYITNVEEENEEKEKKKKKKTDEEDVEEKKGR